MSTEHLYIQEGIVAFKTSHKLVKQLKQKEHAPALHGNKVWSSSFAMMRFFKDNPLPEQTRALEIGCGWGVLSCYLAKMQKASVLATDADENVEPFFHLTAKENGLSLPFEQALIEEFDEERLANFDLIVGTDICFWDEMTEMLYQLIARSIDAGVSQICIADPGRDPFWKLSDRCAEDFYGSVHTMRMGKTRSSEKYILCINEA